MTATQMASGPSRPTRLVATILARADRERNTSAAAHRNPPASTPGSIGAYSAIAKLDKYHLLILDDFAYVSRDQAETSVLFELISARYERRSLLITANQPFGEWNRVFPDPAMTLAAVDRLVHHATIFEMNVESYRRRTAQARRTGAGRPAAYTTPKVLETIRDNQDENEVLARGNHILILIDAQSSS